jgi:hypothetical protein
MRRFLLGTIFGVILLPLLYIGRFFLKRRREKVDVDYNEWP